MVNYRGADIRLMNQIAVTKRGKPSDNFFKSDSHMKLLAGKAKGSYMPLTMTPRIDTEKRADPIDFIQNEPIKTKSYKLYIE